MGESGVEVIARNSHSLGVISDHAHPAKHFLVVYGGASPEHGPLQDTVYAELPEADAIGECYCFARLFSLLRD